jgi:hypothetical protein
MPAPVSTTFTDLWLAETVRLREEHWGPLEDRDAVRQARLADGAIEDRVLLRARLIARREGLDRQVADWRQGAYIAAAVLVVLAILAGAGAAWSALGDGSRVVNVVWAVASLLGLHLLTFLLWLISFAAAPRTAGSGLAQAWLWLTRKVARGPDAALAPQALLTLVNRARATRWLFGTVSHLVWLVAMAAALATLVGVLATARYRFGWATTLLAPESFVRLTEALGWLPARLGFTLPDAALVRLSDGGHALPAQAHAQWAWWLIGLLVVYGVLPRLVAWIISTAYLRRAMRALRVDMTQPGYAALRGRLQPPAESLSPEGASAPPGALDTAAASVPPLTGDRPVLAGLELPADIAWPPNEVPPTVQVAGNLDSREQRNALLDALAAMPARRLLLACDVRQTPDRGTMALIADLCGKAVHMRIWLTSGSVGAGGRANEPGHADRASLWRSRLMEAGMPADAILRDGDRPLQWLGDAHG